MLHRYQRGYQNKEGGQGLVRDSGKDGDYTSGYIAHKFIYLEHGTQRSPFAPSNNVTSCRRQNNNGSRDLNFSCGVLYLEGVWDYM